MNPLAAAANEAIESTAPSCFLPHRWAKSSFFRKGILTQSAEAKEKAHRYNILIGIATESGHKDVFGLCARPVC